MTSLDDDGSTQDEVRRTAPADPWMTEAPTTAINAEAPTSATNDTPDPTATAPYPDWYQAPDPDRRRRRRLVTVLAVIAVLAAAPLAIDQFGSDDNGDTAGPRPTNSTTPATEKTTANTPTAVRPAANPPATTGNSPAPQVVYEITASGTENTGSIAYTDQDGQTIRRHGIPLPWRTTFPVGSSRKPLILDAQRKGGGDAGPLTCTITVDGKLIASTTADGRYASALCSGSA
ncbi:MmpS family transport accessory protein [Actinoplanes sichuanensis]|uniref:MmpS family transport accessory protein n=1 Tax=Actinoplanes sichuanensis TaxID=512349 RepID=A0ABW4A8A3_9ACTN|nr:MmpS family transport accessory protein [Actinoplanes sichuanensis]